MATASPSKSFSSRSILPPPATDPSDQDIRQYDMVKVYWADPQNGSLHERVGEVLHVRDQCVRVFLHVNDTSAWVHIRQVKLLGRGGTAR